MAAAAGRAPADRVRSDLPGTRIGSFDCIASIATLHHLPFARTPRRLRDALRGAVAMAGNVCMRLVRNGELRQDPEVRRIWEEHGRTDRYLGISELREVAARELPDSRVRKHLFWRYSLVWHKPG